MAYSAPGRTAFRSLFYLWVSILLFGDIGALYAQVVNFPDPALDQTLTNKLNKTPSQLTVAYMATLTNLNLSVVHVGDPIIRDTSGLETAFNARFLDLSGSMISNYSGGNPAY